MRNKVLLLCFLLLTGPSFCAASSASASTSYTPQPTFPVSNNASAIVYNSTGSIAYVATGVSCTILVVDTATSVTTRTVPITCGIADAISDIKLIPGTNKLWVATDTVMHSMDTTTFAVSDVFNSLGHIREFSVSQDGATAYVSELSSAGHSYSTSSGAQLCTFGLGFAGNVVTSDVSPDGTRLALTTTGPGSSIVIFELVPSICYLSRWTANATGTTRSAVWAADSSHLYVGFGSVLSSFGVRYLDRDGGNVSTLNTTGLPYSLSLSPDGSTILMAQSDSRFGLIDVSSTTVTSQSLTYLSDASVAAYNPTGASAFLANSTSSVILPLEINPPVGPGVPTPTPTPTPTPSPSPSPSSLPNTGINFQSLDFSLLVAGGMLLVGAVFVAIPIIVSRRRAQQETKPLN